MPDIERLTKNLLVLADVLGAELSEMKLAFYVEALSEFSDDQIDVAVVRAGKTLKWFPKPVELIELLTGSSEERAIMAWDSVLMALQRHGTGMSILWEDGRIAKAIQMMGGWEQMGMMKTDDVKWKQKEFLQLYRSLPAMPEMIVHGRFATDNSARGFLENIPDPIRINGNGLMLESKRNGAHERLPGPGSNQPPVSE